MNIKPNLHNSVSITTFDSEFLASLKNFIAVYEENNAIQIPISIFSIKNLGILECLVKYLKENLNLRYNDIAKYLVRDQRTIWATYNKAFKKHKDKFVIKESQKIPINVFADRIIGPLESLVLYLKDNSNMELKEISKLINRDYQTVWISYKNAVKKRTRSE